ncbi:hypothetical protein ACFX13_031307 [Malus domestica]
MCACRISVPNPDAITLQRKVAVVNLDHSTDALPYPMSYVEVQSRFGDFEMVDTGPSYTISVLDPKKIALFCNGIAICCGTMQDDIIVDPMESPEIVDDPFQTIRANLTSADMRESDFSGSTFNGAYMEKVVTYKANFEGRAWWHVLWVGVCTAGEAVEPWVKKMGPNSELRSSSLKIRRKHFLSTIFWHLSANLSLLIQLGRTVYLTNFISSWPKESIILATEKNTLYNCDVLVCGML